MFFNLLLQRVSKRVVFIWTKLPIILFQVGERKCFKIFVLKQEEKKEKDYYNNLSLILYSLNNRK